MGSNDGHAMTEAGAASCKGSLPTESFETSPLAEAQQILSTYMLLEQQGGVYGDGSVAGMELTRDGRALAACHSTRDYEAWRKRLEEAKRGPLSGHRAPIDDRQTDRYGFFLDAPFTDTDQRTCLLPAAAYKSGSVQPATSPVPQKASLTAARSPGQAERDKEAERLKKWQDMLEHLPRSHVWTVRADVLATSDGRKRLRKRIYKGIPDRWRPAVWPILACRTADLTPVPYLEQDSAPWSEKLARGELTEPSVHDTQIDLDIPRTLGSHTLFATRYGKGQRMLFELLHEQSQACACFFSQNADRSEPLAGEDCGYCQGMATIAAFCLAYGAPSVFHKLHGYAPSSKSNGHGNHSPGSNYDKYHLHDIMRQGFPGLHRCFDRQEKLGKEWMPAVQHVLEKHNIHPSSYATRWYITLFTSGVFSYEVQLRVWDAYLLEGQDMLVVASLGILWGLRGHILHPNADFESIMNAVSGTFAVEDPDAFLRWCRKKMQRLRTAN